MRQRFVILLLWIALVQASSSSATSKKNIPSKNNPSSPAFETDDKGGDVISLPTLFSWGVKDKKKPPSSTNEEEQKTEAIQHKNTPKPSRFRPRKQKQGQQEERSITPASPEKKKNENNNKKQKISGKGNIQSEVKTKSSSSKRENSSATSTSSPSKEERAIESVSEESENSVESSDTKNEIVDSSIQTAESSSNNAKEGHSTAGDVEIEKNDNGAAGGADRKKDKELKDEKKRRSNRWFAPKRKKIEKQSTPETQETEKDLATTSIQSQTDLSSTTGNSTSIVYIRPPPQSQQQQQLQGHPQHPQQSMILFPGPPQQQQQGRPGPPQITGSAVIASYTLSLLSTIIRLWFITSLTKWFQEEELVRPTQLFVWERLNDRYVRDTVALSNVVSAPPMGVSERRWRRVQRKQKRDLQRGRRFARNIQQQSTQFSQQDSTLFDRTVLVIEIKPNEKGTMDLKHLKSIVSFLLAQHRQHAFGSRMVGETVTQKQLEIVLLVESPGGAVQDFGLAAAEVGRLSNEKGISTTVCVDNVAASGGYMIASQAHKLCAAPFAIVGSIGVIRESFNLNGALEKQGVKGVVLKAGHSKAPISMFGPLTKEDVKTAQRVIDKMHTAFQRSVTDARPALVDSVDAVCNGDIYLGTEAKELSLVDRVVTSEEYIFERITAGDRVLKLHRSHHAKFGKHRFTPLDFIRHKSAGALRAAWNNAAKGFGGESGDFLSSLVHAGSFLGFAQYLVRHRFL